MKEGSGLQATSIGSPREPVTFTWTPYALPFLVASVLTAALSVYVARHRDTLVGPSFTFMLGVVTVWMLQESLVMLGADVPTKMAMGRSCYPTVMAIAPAVVIVAMRCNGVTRTTPVQWLLLLGVPVAVLPFLFDGVPGLLYRSFGLEPGAPFAKRVIVRGPLFYLILGHSYLLIAWGTWLFARKTWLTWRIHGSDGAFMLAGISVPWLGVSLHALQIQPIPHVDAASLGFAGMAGLLSLGFKRTGLLGVMGVGRRAVVDVMHDGVLVADRRGLVLDANRAACEILDRSASALTGATLEQTLASHPGLFDAYRECLSQGDESGEVEIQLPSGTRTFHLDVAEMGRRTGQVACHVLVMRDVSDRKRAEWALERESEYVQLIQRVAVASHEAGTVDGALEESLRLICETMRWPVGQVAVPASDGTDALVASDIRYVEPGSGLADLLSQPAARRSEDRDGLIQRAWRSGRPEVSGIQAEGPDRPLRALGRHFGIHALMVVPVVLEDEVPAVLELGSREQIDSEDELLGVFAHLGSMLGRVIERKRNEQRIRELAYFDGLTGLPNRELFLQELGQSLEMARSKGSTIALLFVDLDGFKRINDTLGHSAGDSLLRQVSKRFSAHVRSRDLVGRAGHPIRSSISRLGGDEFTVLLDTIASPQDAEVVATRLLGSLTRPFEIAGAEVFAGASIGIAVHPHDAADAEALLRNADAAMYAAKAKGTGCVQFYSDSMNRESRRRLELEGMLRQALERHELRLHFQPFRQTKSGQIVAAEALLRWERPDEGAIPPSEFIPVAERSGLILPIGDWVLERACEQAAAWREGGFAPIRVAVNVSGMQIRHGGFADKVAAVLARTGLPAGALEIEITESAIRTEDPGTLETLAALHELGVGLALDDFGTGTSSLTHLRRFPIQRLKVDRSFVMGIPDDPQDASLTAAIIAMAHGLGIRVVAEGVETEAQARFLSAHACDELQGFGIARPMPAEEMDAWLGPEEKPAKPD
jgi:diguanylate cyclase (GGDEF)-like protein/PAS domain S-box-containing protein